MKLKGNTVVVANTKGGAGKSTISTMVIPTLFGEGKEINLFEIDNNNRSTINNSSIEFKTITLSEAETTLDNVYFDVVTENDEVLNIVDCGGGDDTVKILEHIKTSDFDGLTYIIPLNDDIEQYNNAMQTIELIKRADKSGVIYLILNKVNTMDELQIKKQFVGLFGNDDYGIESRFDEIEKEIDGFYFIRNTTIFGILKNFSNTTLFDEYPKAKDIVENIKEYRTQWGKEGKEVFSKKMKIYRFAKDIVALVEELLTITK